MLKLVIQKIVFDKTQCCCDCRRFQNTFLKKETAMKYLQVVCRMFSKFEHFTIICFMVSADCIMHMLLVSRRS